MQERFIGNPGDPIFEIDEISNQEEQESTLLPLTELAMPEISDVAAAFAVRKMTEHERMVTRLHELYPDPEMFPDVDPEARHMRLVLEGLQAEFSLQNPEMNTRELLVQFDYKSAIKTGLIIAFDEEAEDLDDLAEEDIEELTTILGTGVGKGIQSSLTILDSSGVPASTPQNTVVEAVRIAEGIAENHNVSAKDVFLQEDLYLELVRILSKSPEDSREGLKKMVSLFKGNLFSSAMHGSFSGIMDSIGEATEEDKAELDKDKAEAKIVIEELLKKMIRPLAQVFIEDFARKWGDEEASKIDLEEMLSTEPDYIFEKN